jgi:Ca-activated chloride channel family protein
LVVRERWPDNPFLRLFTKDLFLHSPLPDWRQRLKRLRSRRRR